MISIILETSFAIKVTRYIRNIIASVAVAVINRYSQCAFNRRNDIYDYYIDSRGFTNTVTQIVNIVEHLRYENKVLEMFLLFFKI